MTSPEVTAGPSTSSPLKTRQGRKCQSCHILRKSLQENRLKHIVQRKARLTVSKAKKQSNATRVLNQKIKRKEKMLNQLKQTLDKSELGLKLQDTKKKLYKAKKGKDKLNQRHKAEIAKVANEVKESASMTIGDLQMQLKGKEDVIKQLQHEKLLLEEKLEGKVSTLTKTEGKYSTNMRLFVFDCIINQVPTSNIPNLMLQFSKRIGQPIKFVPHRSTVEMIDRELRAISDLQTAEMLVDTKNVTIGFNATTREGQHANSIHLTSEEKKMRAGLEELPGGTKEDYAEHIFQTIDGLAETYCEFKDDQDYGTIRSKMISNITNSMSDRCAAMLQWK